MRLSRAAGDIVLKLLEQPQCTIVERTLLELSEPAGLELRKLGAIVEFSTARSLIVADDRGERSVDVSWNAQTGSYCYFDSADCFVPVPASSLRVLRLEFRWWLAWLAAHLELANSGKPTELVPDQAWDLGDLWVGSRRKVPVVFARRQRKLVDVHALVNALRSRAGRAAGVLLTSTPVTRFEAPLEYRVRPIALILTPDALRFELDRKSLSAAFDSTEIEVGIDLSPDNRVLSLHGETFVLRGEKQPAILRKLINAHRQGKRLRTAEVLANHSANSFAKAFRGSPHWPKLKSILRQEGGMCWLEV